jgi:HAD superfamily hydrolase (TIGR01484 family)
VQPIRTLPVAAARSLTGVCFDVDDTLTRDGVLEPAAYAALFALRHAGLKLVAVTGRPLGFAEVFARSWPIDAAVGENGAGFVARAGRRTRVEYWDTEAVRQRQAEQLARLRARLERELPEVRVSSDGWARRCDLAFDVGEELELPRAQIEQLVALIEAEGARATVSSVHAHAQLGDHDKARGVARAAELLWQLAAEQVRSSFLFVGDSGNDAAAFAWFEHTAGVANVAKHLDRLPVPPGFVAHAQYGEGFAEIAAVVLEKRAERS